MVRVDTRPGLERELEAQLNSALEEATLEAAKGLRRRLSYSSEKRTGEKYEHHPRRSSAWGEYPQQQTGQLRDSVDSGPYENLKAQVGFNVSGGDLEEKVWYLEKRGGKGLRRPLFRYFEGDDSESTRANLARGIRRALRSR